MKIYQKILSSLKGEIIRFVLNDYSDCHVKSCWAIDKNLGKQNGGNVDEKKSMNSMKISKLRVDRICQIGFER